MAGSSVPVAGAIFLWPTQKDWYERVSHLQNVHKFRECDWSKRFYRADHFREHLRHTHAAISGKWTYALADSCRVDQDQTPSIQEHFE